MTSEQARIREIVRELHTGERISLTRAETDLMAIVREHAAPVHRELERETDLVEAEFREGQALIDAEIRRSRRYELAWKSARARARFEAKAAERWEVEAIAWRNGYRPRGRLYCWFANTRLGKTLELSPF